MKLGIIAATALVLSASTAMAGGFNGPRQAPAPQFANASALNLVVQVAKIRGSKISKLEQVTGATALAKNKAVCGCVSGVQAANAHSKNVTLQLGMIENHHGFAAKLSQTSVSSATAVNIRGY